MENEFDEIMKQHSDAELMEVLNSAPGDYKDSAMESARREFQSRKLSAEKVKEINEGIEQKKDEEAAELNAPPDKPSKMLAFFLPSFLGLINLGSKADKYSELGTYTFFGYIFYGCVIALVLILRYYFHWHFLD